MLLLEYARCSYKELFKEWCTRHEWKVKNCGFLSADGSPCEAGLEIDGCEIRISAPHCVPCGLEGESCCKVSDPCGDGLMCLEYDICGTCGGLQEPPCPSTISLICYQCDGEEIPSHLEVKVVFAIRASLHKSVIVGSKRLSST
jgi:hypothetical protein